MEQLVEDETQPGPGEIAFVVSPQRLRKSHTRGFLPASGYCTELAILRGGEVIQGAVMFPLNHAETSSLDDAWAQQALENSYWEAQRRLPFGTAGEPSLMTARERHSLGLAPSPHLDDLGGAAAEALQRALDRLHERIGKDNLQSLLRDARRVAEQQFLQRALARAGSVDALARALGVSRRALLRRGGAALRTMKT